MDVYDVDQLKNQTKYLSQYNADLNPNVYTIMVERDEDVAHIVQDLQTIDGIEVTLAPPMAPFYNPGDSQLSSLWHLD